MNILFNTETNGFEIAAHPDSDTDRDGRLILLACALPPHINRDIGFDPGLPHWPVGDDLD